MEEMRLGFVLRVIHNLTRSIISNSCPKRGCGPKSQLQAGILGYLYHHQEQPVYQKHIEEEFNISRATATNTLQGMEKGGIIVRSSVDKDARLKRIVMTPEALANHRIVEAHIEMMERSMRKGLTDSEVSELFRILGIVKQNLEEIATDKEIERTENGINEPECRE